MSEQFTQTGSDQEKLVSVLSEGGVAVFPTDTVFGIGCRIDNEQAIQRVFAIKQRPLNQPMPILLSDRDILTRYVNPIPSTAKLLMDKYWPGPLTLVMPVKQKTVTPLLVNQDGMASFRIPNHELLRKVIEQVGMPITGTSANVHGSPSIANVIDLDKTVQSKVDCIFAGKTNLGVESTVVAVSGQHVSILRESAIKKSEIEQLTGILVK